MHRSIMWILLFLFLFYPSLSNGAIATDPLEQERVWATAVTALKENNLKLAIDSLERWIRVSENVGSYSAEAYYNLGVAYYRAENPTAANYNLLRSIQLRNFPLRAWQDLSTITEIQKQLGIKKAITDRVPLKIALLANTNTLLVMTSVGFWLIGISLLLVWKRRFRLYILDIIGGFFWILALAGYINRGYWGRFAVLNGHGNEVPLYKLTENSEREILVSLPSGTLVTTGKEKELLIQVLEPFSGWVNVTDIQATAGTPLLHPSPI